MLLKHPKIICVLLLLCVVSPGVYAQSKREQLILDTLKQELNSSKSSEQSLIILNNLCLFTINYHPDQTIAYADSGLRLAKKSRLFKYGTLFHQTKGEIYMNRGDFKNSLKQYDSSYNLAVKYKINKLIRNVSSDYGVLYELQGSFALAQSYFFKALKLAEAADDADLTRLCYANIGVVFVSEKNFDKAIFYAGKALELSKNGQSPVLEAKADESFGTAYDNLAKHDKARGYYNKALAIYQGSKNEMGMASIYTLLAATYINQPLTQLPLNLKAKAIYDKLAPGDIYAILNLGDLGRDYAEEAYLAMKNKQVPDAESDKLFRLAEKYLSQSVNLAKTGKVKDAIISLADSLASVDAAIGKYEDAYKNLRYHDEVNDSVYSQENKNKIASLESKHEIELRDQQLKINKLEIANQHKQEWFLIAGVLTLTLVASLIYYQNYQRKKTNKVLLVLNNELDEANKVKTRFFNILNHDLRRPVASFVNFLHLQQEPGMLNNDQRDAFSKKATQLASRLLENMEDLLLWSKGQMENFKPDIKQIAVENIFENIRSAGSMPENIGLNFEQQPGMMLQTDEHYIKTITYNLTNNAVQALGKKANGVITWKAWNEGGQQFLSITDNGPGAGDGAFRALYDDSAPIGIKDGLGLHIVRDLAKAIGCEVVVKADKDVGVEIVINFPATVYNDPTHGQR